MLELAVKLNEDKANWTITSRGGASRRAFCVMMRLGFRGSEMGRRMYCALAANVGVGLRTGSVV